MSNEEIEKRQLEEECEDEEVEEMEEDGEEDGDEEEDEDVEEEETEVVKKKKPGLIYLSTIPPNMNVQVLRETFMAYGDVGRIYLQPQTKGENKKRKGKAKPRKYVEGWIEFLSKKTAKRV